jgi:nitrogenase molybdenum-iron protein alpha/beta subunit
MKPVSLYPRFQSRMMRCDYTCYMSSQPIRIGKETLQVLRERSKGSGEPIARLAERYIEEGLRADRHPGVFFRDGPAGRRAVVVGGPDVWEIVSAVRSAPEKGEALVSALAERLGISDSKIRVAIRYYADYADEVDAWIAANDAEAERLEAALARERELLA